ncbi:MAG: SCO family protein [Vicinamibacteria bacterium]
MRTKHVVILFAVALSVEGLGFARSSRVPAARSSSLPFYDSRDFTPRWSAVDHRIEPFHLVDQNNAAFTEHDLDGRIHVASFLFAECPSLCPTMVERLKPVQKALSSRAGVMMVSYTVTPLTDTPSVLSQFGRRRGIDPAIWRLATGELSEIRSVLHDSYFADDTRPLGNEEQSKLLHTEKVLLVDGQRRIRGIYNGTSAFEMERLVEDIDALRVESGRAMS